MAINHVNTEITGDAAGSVIRMCFADNSVVDEAKASVELKVPFSTLSLADQGDYFQPGTYAHTRFQIAALRYVRDALTAEIQRLSNPEHVTGAPSAQSRHA
jgi:hypothetical protein